MKPTTDDGNGHHRLVNDFYRAAADLEPYQLAHVVKAVAEHCLLKLKGEDRTRVIKDLKSIIKRAGAL